MLRINLDNEEKLQVLLVALCLFLIALFISLCLAIPFCPLNKWLLERDSKRRHLLLQQPPAYILTQQSIHLGANNVKCNNANFSGPPPAYEAALRAKRLQSLTGNIPKIEDPNESKQADNSWFSPSLERQQQQHEQLQVQQQQIPQQLDFGDYFHQPKEFNDQPAAGQHVYIPMSERTQTDRSCHVPIMMRLWVRMIEPGELVARARGLHGRQASTSSSLSRGLSLSRPLSIPHLLGSLVTMAGSRKQLSDDALGSFREEQQAHGEEQRQSPDSTNEPPTQVTIDSTSCPNNTDQQFNSLSSISDSSITFTSSQYAERVVESKSDSSNKEQPKTEEGEEKEKRDGEGKDRREGGDKQQETTTKNKSTYEKQLNDAQATSGIGCHNKRSVVSINSITSRVLHMNVASFSYVKDETIISSKKHNQMNYQHFTSSQANNFAERFQSNEEQAENLFRKFDLNNDGIITLDEFLEACHKVSSRFQAILFNLSNSSSKNTY